MKIFFDPIQKSHILTHEIISGKRIRHHERRQRLEVIIRALRAHGGFVFQKPEPVPRDAIVAVHDETYVRFLETSREAAAEEIIWPYVFPCDIRIPVREPVSTFTAGHFCFDVGTPIMRDTWTAASAAASDAYAAARYLRKTDARVAYALARPPGHHASQNKFGGYCYLNNAAIAARYLARHGKVLLIDFDFHHGNGTQSIFYDSCDVFYLSLHADPTNEYPYFTGFADEIGLDDGVDYNLNCPLPKFCGPEIYLAALQKSIEKAVKKMEPAFVVVSAGFDIGLNDPLGHFGIEVGDFARLGRIICGLGKKTLIVQEGGYRIESLGDNVLSFLGAFMR